MKKIIIIIISLFGFCNSQIAQNCHCDHTITASQLYVDGSILNILPGDTICIEASTKSYLQLVNFHGDSNNYIVFINCGGPVIVQNAALAYVIKLGNCSFFRFTGTGSNGFQYGIKAFGSNGNGLSIFDKSTNYEIDHIEVANTGFAGIMAKSDPTCDLSANFGNFTQYQTIIHDNFIHNIGGEGFYVGHSYYTGYPSNCNSLPDTLFPHELKGVRIYNNIVDSSHWDGIQVGCVTEDCEIFGNKVINYGVDAIDGQNNGIQISAGTTGKCYNNYIAEGTGSGIIIFGIGNNSFFNNVIIHAGLNYYPSDITKKVYGIFCDDRATIAGRSFNFYNNTIINPKTDGIRFTSTMSDSNRFYNNLIVEPGSLGSYSPYSTGNSFINIGSGVSALLSNNYYDTIKSKMYFVDTLLNNYRLLSSSPAIDVGINLTNYSINLDFDNNPRPSGAFFDVGAFEYQIPSTIIETNVLSNNISLFPNPNKGEFTILSNNSFRFGNYKLSVFDMLGNKIYFEKSNATNKINVDICSIVATGLYLLQISTRDFIINKKIIIQ
ncbi:MAG: T9SS type A sorting domain-containing protein [Bacteroidia bacterium]